MEKIRGSKHTVCILQMPAKAKVQAFHCNGEMAMFT